jgi:hypothetical protein
MLKSLAIFMVLNAFLFGRPSMSEQYESRAHTAQNKTDQYQRVMPQAEAAANPPATGPCSQAEPCWTENASADKPLPRFERPEWVIVYVTILYAIIAWLTLLAIKRQGDTMKKQAADARQSAKDATITAQNTLNAIERQVINLRRQANWLKLSAHATRINAKAALISAKTMLAQVTLMQDTAERQLRAYLCISKGRLNFTKEGPLEPQIHIVNGGQTPAYEVRSWIDTAVREHPSFGPLQLAAPSDEVRAVGIIPPKGKEIMVSRKVPREKANETFLQTRYQILYVYGEITYKDAFGHDRYTKFRLIFGGPAGTRRKIDQDGVEMGFLSMDSEGNEAS